MKKLVWVYRILLGLFLLAMLIWLVVKGLAAFWGIIVEPLLLWLIDLYPPYSGYALLGSFLLGCVFVVFSTARDALRAKREHTEPSSEIPEGEEMSAAFARLAAQYGITLATGDTEFCLPFQNPEHAIWCADNEIDFIVGLTGSLHHEHYVYMEEAQEEIEAIRTEKKVHMIFFDSNGAEHWNDLYAVQDLDSETSARFHPIQAHQPWWERCLRIIFLVSPPFTPEVLRAEIYSYRGSYDRTVFKEA